MRTGMLSNRSVTTGNWACF